VAAVNGNQIPRITIRVVKVPTTGELLDEYYRQRGLVHGSGSEPDVRGTGGRRIAPKGSSAR
jgi:hypothetical protein